MNKLLKELARQIAQRDGIQRLRPGQQRPLGYYMGSHYTGKSRIPRGAVIDVGLVADETVDTHRADEETPRRP